MNDTPNNSSNDTNSADTDTDNKRQAAGGNRRRFLIFGGLGLASIAGLLSTRVWAHGRGLGHGRHGMHAKSAAELREHLGHVSDRVLTHLNASDAQRTQAGAVLDRGAPKLFALRQRGEELHARAHEAFASGDRQALELARSRAVKLFDDLSVTSLDMLHELHAVLDPDQQARLRAHMASHRGGRGHFWH